MGEEKDRMDNKKENPAPEAGQKYIFRLYIAGTGRKSARAIATLTRVCEQHLAGLYSLEIIDILEQPAAARDNQIIATPTLIRQLPAPVRKLIGDMTDKEKVIMAIELKPEK